MFSDGLWKSSSTTSTAACGTANMKCLCKTNDMVQTCSESNGLVCRSSNGKNTFSSCVCPAGKYKTSLTSNCQQCPIGRYSNEYGQNSIDACKACNPGMYTTCIGSAACRNCAVGMEYVSTTKECSVCAAGKFQGQGSNEPLFSCDAVGIYEISQGIPTATCLTCPAGFYNNDNASVSVVHRSCFLCPTLQWSDTGASFCIACGAGTFTLVGNSTSATECVDCEKGEYQDNGSRDKCIECPFGWYQRSTKKSFCLPCTPGHYQDVKGETKCKTCQHGQHDTGKWPTRNASTVCENCEYNNNCFFVYISYSVNAFQHL